MLMRTDPFREMDRLAEQFFGTTTRPAVMHLDAYRDGDWFYAAFDLPGVDPESIDCTVERNVLTVRAERRRPTGDKVELVAAERPMGVFTRQLFLGDTLDTDKLEAGYENGVLTLRIPVAERAKPRRVNISTSDNGRREIRS
ncbi:Hsp20/alpha crystallin family protein [Plantactinospora sp. GCM10030261]|uniref:Hsp20/alpha crystallin family protein n=1 Tax=Plantactinospora sp. GCM10030261 TaxID=3273420 RepID=UPI0036107F02